MNLETARFYETLVAMFLLAAPATPPTSALDVRIEAIGEFRQNEGCIAGFKRYGHRVSVKQCIAMAQKAGVEVSVAISESGSQIFDVHVKEGDPFAIIRRNGKLQYMLYKQP